MRARVQKFNVKKQKLCVVMGKFVEGKLKAFNIVK